MEPMEVYETLPIVPLRDVVVFPHMMMPFVIGRPSSTRALEHALLKDKRIFLAAQHDASVDDPRPEDIFTMGCVANVVQSLKLPDGNIKVLVEGVDRGVVLGREEDPLVLEQRMLQRAGRRRPSDDERHHHVRKHNNVPQRDDGEGFVEFHVLKAASYRLSASSSRLGSQRLGLEAGSGQLETIQPFRSA